MHEAPEPPKANGVTTQAGPEGSNADQGISQKDTFVVLPSSVEDTVTHVQGMIGKTIQNTTMYCGAGIVGETFPENDITWEPPNISDAGKVSITENVVRPMALLLIQQVEILMRERGAENWEVEICGPDGRSRFCRLSIILAFKIALDVGGALRGEEPGCFVGSGEICALLEQLQEEAFPLHHDNPHFGKALIWLLNALDAQTAQTTEHKK